MTWFMVPQGVPSFSEQCKFIRIIRWNIWIIKVYSNKFLTEKNLNTKNQSCWNCPLPQFDDVHVEHALFLNNSVSLFLSREILIFIHIRGTILTTALPFVLLPIFGIAPRNAMLRIYNPAGAQNNFRLNCNFQFPYNRRNGRACWKSFHRKSVIYPCRRILV